MQLVRRLWWHGLVDVACGSVRRPRAGLDVRRRSAYALTSVLSAGREATVGGPARRSPCRPIWVAHPSTAQLRAGYGGWASEECGGRLEPTLRRHHAKDDGVVRARRQPRAYKEATHHQARCRNERVSTSLVCEVSKHRRKPCQICRQDDDNALR